MHGGFERLLALLCGKEVGGWCAAAAECKCCCLDECIGDVEKMSGRACSVLVCCEYCMDL